MCKILAREAAAAAVASFAITKIEMGKRTLTPAGRPKPLTKTQLEAAASQARAERDELNAILGEEALAA